MIQARSVNLSTTKFWSTIAIFPIVCVIPGLLDVGNDTLTLSLKPSVTNGISLILINPIFSLILMRPFQSPKPAASPCPLIVALICASPIFTVPVDILRYIENVLELFSITFEIGKNKVTMCFPYKHVFVGMKVSIVSLFILYIMDSSGNSVLSELSSASFVTSGFTTSNSISH